MQSKRRRFLRSAAGATAGAAMACDTDAEARAAAAPVPESKPKRATANAALPQIRIGKHRVSRLVIGSNPIHGYSHFNKLFSTHMTEWATTERVCDLMESCEREGINTWQFSHHERAMTDFRAHRERGGKLQWILLSHREIEEDHSLLKDLVKLGPAGIVHHGGSAERKRRQGKIDQVKDFLKAVRDSGAQVGLSTHDPEFLEQTAEEGWDVDFYMTALYYLTRTTEQWRKLLGTRPLGEIYLPEDPPRMFAAIRGTKKPCLAYKVLAAGRLTNTPNQVDRAFRSTLENIKPNDGMIIGMYPRFSDQVHENAERVRRIVGG